MLEVRDIMTPAPIQLHRTGTIEDARERLLAYRISGAPVVDDGRVVGVVSKTDLLRAKPGATVEDVMTPFVAFVCPNDPAQIAVDLMLSQHVHRLIVLEPGGAVAGIVSTTDVLRAVQRGTGLSAPASLADPELGGLSDDGY